MIGTARPLSRDDLTASLRSLGVADGDVVMALRRLMPITRHVQIASVPSRNEPDGEELNFPYLFVELDRLGFDGYVAGEYRPRTTTLEGLGWFAPYKGKR